MRVRIEKLPANESFINPEYLGLDHPVGISPCSIALPKYNASDEILNVNVTNLELVPNFDSVGRKKDNNLTVRITLKKLNHRNNASVLETSDPESTLFHDAGSHSVRSDVPGIEDDRSTEDGKYDRTNEKSRAKRNQEIMSRRYLRNDKNAMRSRRFGDEQGTSVGDTRQRTRYRKARGNRAARSIEEIKDLAEKLIVKVRDRSGIASSQIIF